MCVSPLCFFKRSASSFLRSASACRLSSFFSSFSLSLAAFLTSSACFAASSAFFLAFFALSSARSWARSASTSLWACSSQRDSSRKRSISALSSINLLGGFDCGTGRFCGRFFGITPVRAGASLRGTADSASNSSDSCVGLVLSSPSGEKSSVRRPSSSPSSSSGSDEDCGGV